jgi:CDP-diacylglycerol---glycerol-3-phosphate 3-phosphatidyltransferase
MTASLTRSNSNRFRNTPFTNSVSLDGLQRSRQPKTSTHRPTVTTQAAADNPSTASKTILTLPTILTLARVAAIPSLIYIWFLPDSSLTCTLIFLAAAITDFLDGYLARKMKITSAFGAFLDPVADKLMVATVLILLSTRALPLITTLTGGVAAMLSGNTWLMPVMTCLIIGREITMSALREWAAALGPQAHSAVAVSWMGKWKTATQMIALTALLLAHSGVNCGGVGDVAAFGGVIFLFIASVLTVWSLFGYFAGLWKFMV